MEYRRPEQAGDMPQPLDASPVLSPGWWLGVLFPDRLPRGSSPEAVGDDLFGFLAVLGGSKTGVGEAISFT